ncbi:MAG: hypothetical protein OEY41_15935 [Acidimicrobiia bacterium]|nr:hypothetical protein [Acidimicrobiia bacterium]MDH5291485.1 hypothetical protein [Acidimicrobiia bacterium]
MTEPTVLDRAHATIMAQVVTTARAPHHTELAATLGIGIEEARAAIDGLWAAGVPGWVHPGTDLIASFPPFNLQPTQYRISIDGKPGWYGQ